ncbi:hypothetical protein [Ornithinimicrobium cryptoxanthini]|uniref:Heavy metal transporter n=1 Tax=Ornithinimicrobium cryptoxanthini TaxID=2934161 RepID=A0ABY4YKM2_9MICO|nr:hypothetical protein [Ornithinimicrobium cryptoxanthini]USQ77106.1 hypothetical protein NF557_04090 [Ornithinimicrobium cryptoxanthini]
MTPAGQMHPAAEARRPRWRGRAVLAGATAVAVLAGALGARWLVDEFRNPACEFTVGDQAERRTPEQAANASTISMVSLQRGLPPKAATIALATAVQESKLRNLSYGDADSLGLFQQRPSQGWGTPEQVTDPVYAANAFFAALEAVPGWSEWVVTEIAQEVQRSAYPDAYADHEAEARVMASALVGQTHAGVACRLDPVAAAGSPDDVLAKAERTFSGQGSVDGTTVTLQGTALDEAWAIASWAVTHAETESITSVQVADRQWLRDQDPLTWHQVTDGDPTGTTVTITVAND